MQAYVKSGCNHGSINLAAIQQCLNSIYEKLSAYYTNVNQIENDDIDVPVLVLLSHARLANHGNSSLPVMQAEQDSLKKLLAILKLLECGRHLRKNVTVS